VYKKDQSSTKKAMQSISVFSKKVEVPNVYQGKRSQQLKKPNLQQLESCCMKQCVHVNSPSHSSLFLYHSPHLQHQ